MDAAESPLTISPSPPLLSVPNAISTLLWTESNSRWSSRSLLLRIWILNRQLCIFLSILMFVLNWKVNFVQETLLDLLSTAGRRPCLPMVVCCSTRDELDAVSSNVSNLSSDVSVSLLYSDLSEVDRALVLDNFRQATVRWNKLGREEEADEEVGTEEERKSHVIVVTDACLPLLGSVELPFCARMLINYELPTKKETYMRRMAACLSADGIVVSMVVGGEVVILKSLEENSGLVIAEMPIHIFEMI